MSTKKAHKVSSAEFNTNNSWGFGGGIGTADTYSNGWVRRAGTAYYRHMKSHKYVTCYNADHRQVSEKEFYENCEKG